MSGTGQTFTPRPGRLARASVMDGAGFFFLLHSFPRQILPKTLGSSDELASQFQRDAGTNFSGDEANIKQRASSELAGEKIASHPSSRLRSVSRFNIDSS